MSKFFDFILRRDKKSERTSNKEVIKENEVLQETNLTEIIQEKKEPQIKRRNKKISYKKLLNIVVIKDEAKYTFSSPREACETLNIGKKVFNSALRGTTKKTRCGCVIYKAEDDKFGEYSTLESLKEEKVETEPVKIKVKPEGELKIKKNSLLKRYPELAAEYNEEKNHKNRGVITEYTDKFRRDYSERKTRPLYAHQYNPYINFPKIK